ncbi:MAG: heavy-metal-associated domain-containing protein [Lachnospiraceae bacterium]|jgi:copper chaperone
MTKTTLKIDGMMCGMCEAHINDAVRRACEVKSVKSNHRRGEAVIVSENPLNQESLAKAIKDTGYTLVSMSTEPYEKKGLFH